MHIDGVTSQRIHSLLNACFACPFCVYPCCSIRTGEEAYEQRFALYLAQPVAYFFEKAFGDIVRKDDFAIGFIVGHGGVLLQFLGGSG